MYSSTIFAYMVLSIFGDYIGRKRFILLGLVTTTAGIMVTLFATNLFMASAGLFVGLTGAQWAFSVSFVFISETVAESHRDKYMVIVQFFYGFGSLGNTALYYWLRDWRDVFVYFYVVPCALLVIATLVFVVDSPICLLKKLEAEEVKEQLLWIARINGVNDP
jgi:MFS family permease